MQTTTTKPVEHLGRPMIFKQEELDSRIAKEIDKFKDSHAAHHRLVAPILPVFVSKLAELLSQGYTLSDALPCFSGRSELICYLRKPQDQQQADREQLAAQVKEKYEQEIESHNTEQRRILSEQLYLAQKKKEEQAAIKAEEKLRSSAEKEAEEYWDTLIAKETK